ncbi:MAG: hypothetical protein ACH349_07265, partial [Candidatus Rhabdochlamydia sp.]
NSPNDLSALDHPSFSPRSPSIHVRRKNSQTDFQEFFAQQILDLSNTIDVYKMELQKREKENIDKVRRKRRVN